MHPREARMGWFDVPIPKISASGNVLELQDSEDC